ncbi:MAG: hypothetical protein HKN23_12025 [Verrucomicrobiales bacterium]|nr:hypothetical protein [Verrucomicrobiales bacterium]
MALSRSCPTIHFLIPPFGILWGWTVLDEQIGRRILIGMLVILLGTAMSAGLLLGPKNDPTGSVR